jgi:signal peptidase I/conjugal transfer pilin signal peptidase TrbI
MQNSLSSRLIIAGGCFAVCLAFIWFAHRHIAITLTPSLRYTLFYLKSGPVQSIRQGEYVVFTLDHPITATMKIKKVIKEVVCTGGQVLTVSGKSYFCSGVYLGSAKEKSQGGEPVNNFSFNGKVPSGCLFVMGHSKDSFDSRYIGFVKTKEVEAMALPFL